MRILYCNLRAKWTVMGHLYFDVKLVHLLSNVAEVTLLYPDEGWYGDVNENIRIEVYDAVAELDRKKWANLGIWSKGHLRRLAIKDHMESNCYIKRVLELSKNEQFDYIFLGTLDFISYYFYRNQLKKAGTLVLIEHWADAFEHGILNRIFMKVKSDFLHVVMEEDGIDALHALYAIDRSSIYHIPHMLNPITKCLDAAVTFYDVVGISNSNDDDEIRKIIDLEEGEHFFENNGIRAIFRSKNLEYDKESLKVFKGRLGLSYDEYYTYVTKAKVMVLPFSVQFGLHSSGTLMDAFSQGIPIVGNPFKTMVQYNRQIPHICKLYSTMNEFKAHILELMSREEKYEKEYQLFRDTHSDGFIIEQMKKMLV